jgi:beta-lactamase class A
MQEARIETPLDIVWRKMSEELKGFCEKSTGVIGYSLLDLDTDYRVSYNENVLLPTASTIKIAVLLGLALKVHSGEINWDQRIAVEPNEGVGGSGILAHFRYDSALSLWDVASLMIALSDNTATNICIRLVGMDYINKIMDSYGLHKTRLKRLMMDRDAVQQGNENVSTPRELVELLRWIYHRNGISDNVAKDVLKILELPKNGPFTEALPDKVRRANKPGGLGHLSVDAGIIYLTKKNFALSVMGAFLDGRPSDTTVPVVRTAYKYMEILNECTALGRS